MPAQCSACLLGLTQMRRALAEIAPSAGLFAEKSPNAARACSDRPHCGQCQQAGPHLRHSRQTRASFGSISAKPSAFTAVPATASAFPSISATALRISGTLSNRLPSFRAIQQTLCNRALICGNPNNGLQSVRGPSDGSSAAFVKACWDCHKCGTPLPRSPELRRAFAGTDANAGPLAEKSPNAACFCWNRPHCGQCQQAEPHLRHSQQTQPSFRSFSAKPSAFRSTPATASLTAGNHGKTLLISDNPSKRPPSFRAFPTTLGLVSGVLSNRASHCGHT